MEEEKDGQLPFLDVLVQRKGDGGLKTTVYRKATNTSRILSCLSNHPLSHTRSCVRTLYRRVETHCTEPADKKAEAQFLRKLFIMNGYPGNFVEKCRREIRGRKPKGQPKPKCWRAVPYIAGLSEEFARLVSEFGIGVAHRPEATIRRQLMQPKDPIPIDQKSGVIYRIDCNCGQASYVGETGKQVRTRMHEHELAVRRNEKLSLVAAHASSPGHAFDFESVRILGQSDNRVARLLQEAWHSTEDTINRHIDLPIAYQALREQISSAAGGVLSDRPWTDALFVNNAALIISGFACVLLPIATSYAGQVSFAITYGLAIAAFVSLRIILLVEMLGLDRLTNAFGFLLLFQGFAFMASPPILAGFYDMLQSFDYTFILAGCSLIFSAILCFPLRPILRWEKRRRGEPVPPSHGGGCFTRFLRRIRDHFRRRRERLASRDVS
nr:unnamed protein product [Spirometra erinaceieuropaei]